MTVQFSLAERMADLTRAERLELLSGYSDQRLKELLYDWRFWGRPKQFAPLGDWFCWLMLAGRGFGKTRAGVEWLRRQVEGETPFIAPPGAPERIALVGHTAADTRGVMLDGESGILSCSPPAFRPVYESSRRRLVWPNGIQAFLYSAEAPDQLRGPQHHIAWADELAKWGGVEACWTNLMFGLRLGLKPRVIVTTTPRPLKILKEIMADPGTVTTHGSSYENSSNLPAAFFEQILSRYEGTRLGRQELDGEILEDVPGALWSRDMIEALRVDDPPEFQRIVVAVDPPVTSGSAADACGIVVAGLDRMKRGYILADRTVQGMSPNSWAEIVIKAYKEFKADRVIAEVNNGGELVEALIRKVAPTVSYRAVRASRGKVARAEPIAALYERGQVFHCAAFPALEDQMCAFTTGLEGFAHGESPDRVDALVWALTDLMMKDAGEPRIRNMM